MRVEFDSMQIKKVYMFQWILTRLLYIMIVTVKQSVKGRGVWFEDDSSSRLRKGNE